MVEIIISMITGAAIASVFFILGRKSVKQKQEYIHKETDNDNVLKIEKALRNEKGFLSYRKYSG